MCLNLRDDCNKPYNGSKIRWKLVRTTNLWSSDVMNASLYGLYQHCAYWHSKDKWNVSEPADYYEESPTVDGFHVFVTRADARRFLKGFNPLDKPNIALKRVRVRGFKKSGSFLTYRCETWNQMKFTGE